MVLIMVRVSRAAVPDCPPVDVSVGCKDTTMSGTNFSTYCIVYNIYIKRSSKMNSEATDLEKASIPDHEVFFSLKLASNFEK